MRLKSRTPKGLGAAVTDALFGSGRETGFDMKLRNGGERGVMQRILEKELEHGQEARTRGAERGRDEDIPLRDRDTWLMDAGEVAKERHEKDLEEEDIRDPLGVAVQQVRRSDELGYVHF